MLGIVTVCEAMSHEAARDCKIAKKRGDSDGAMVADRLAVITGYIRAMLHHKADGKSLNKHHAALYAMAEQLIDGDILEVCERISHDLRDFIEGAELGSRKLIVAHIDRIYKYKKSQWECLSFNAKNELIFIIGQLGAKYKTTEDDVIFEPERDYCREKLGIPYFKISDLAVHVRHKTPNVFIPMVQRFMRDLSPPPPSLEMYTQLSALWQDGAKRLVEKTASSMFKSFARVFETQGVPQWLGMPGRTYTPWHQRNIALQNDDEQEPGHMVVYRARLD